MKKILLLLLLASCGDRTTIRRWKYTAKENDSTFYSYKAKFINEGIKRKKTY